MAHTLIQERLRANIKSALDDAKVASGIDHAVSKGMFREIAIRKLLTPLLRQDLRITTGIAIDSTGAQSPQLDVIVYSPSIVPSIMSEATISCIPIEACLHVVEVKSCLTNSELKKSVRAALALNKMQQVPPGPADALEAIVDKQGDMPIIPTVYSLFAFDTDLAPDKTTELERLHNVLKETAKGLESLVFMHDLCVVGRGYWNNPIHNPTYTAPNAAYAEITEFLLYATDSWPIWLGSRGMRPLRPYL